MSTEAENEPPVISRHEAAKEAARAALATGSTYHEAGQRAEVSERTVARWMATPEFARSVSEQRAEQLGVAAGQLSHVARDAAAVLIEVMTDGSRADKLKAAPLVLAWATRLHRDRAWEARMIKIEQKLGITSAPDSDAEPEGDRNDEEVDG